MTTTNYNTTETIQELSDAELEQINGGNWKFFFKIAWKAVKHIATAGGGLWAIHEIRQSAERGASR